MKDENLTFWTKAPIFFLVATYQGEIVGMIGIQKKEETGTQTGLEGEGTNERFFAALTLELGMATLKTLPQFIIYTAAFLLRNPTAMALAAV